MSVVPAELIQIPCVRLQRPALCSKRRQNTTECQSDTNLQVNGQSITSHDVSCS